MSNANDIGKKRRGTEMNKYENEGLSRGETELEDEGMSVAEQVGILFEYGESKRMVTSYHRVSAAIGIAPINIQKLREGITKNPGLTLLRGIGKYFGVGLGYFDSESPEECWDYLRNAERSRVLTEMVHDVPLRADEITPETLRAMVFAMEQIRKSEEARSGTGR